MSIPPDHTRCLYTTPSGRRCRSVRMNGHDSGLCFFHWCRSRNISIKPHIALVASEILGPEDSLDTAENIN